MDADTDASRETGTVVAWGPFDRHGYARRNRDPRGRQVLVHLNNMDDPRRLEPGTLISFLVTDTAKGLRALRVSTVTRRANE